MRSWISSYWGKAQPDTGQSGSVLPCHPLAWHMLDVAAAAEALLDVRPVLLGRLAAMMGLEKAQAKHLLCWLAAIHDTGKFARSFQCKVEPFTRFIDRGGGGNAHNAVASLWLVWVLRRQWLSCASLRRFLPVRLQIYSSLAMAGRGNPAIMLAAKNPVPFGTGLSVDREKEQAPSWQSGQ